MEKDFTEIQHKNTVFVVDIPQLAISFISTEHFYNNNNKISICDLNPQY